MVIEISFLYICLAWIIPYMVKTAEIQMRKMPNDDGFDPGEKILLRAKAMLYRKEEMNR